MDIELTVVVEAQPEPTVQWWHDGVLIKDSNLYVTKAMTENGQYTLVIKQAVAEAGGTIKCTAENKHGTANTEAKVTVNGTSFHKTYSGMLSGQMHEKQLSPIRSVVIYLSNTFYSE